jgi:hypothetical protein
VDRDIDWVHPKIQSKTCARTFSRRDRRAHGFRHGLRQGAAAARQAPAACTGSVIYSCSMSTTISCATARLDDVPAMTGFLSAIPNSEELAKLLRSREAISSRAYDDETFTARFVASDGRVVKCFVVTDVTIDQAEMIAAACLDISVFEESRFREAVALSLGPTFEPAG